MTGAPDPGDRFAFSEDLSDGLDLRRLTFAGDEVVDRLYFALRDEHWRTVPLVVTRRVEDARPDGFSLDLEARSAWPTHPLELSLRYRAQGAELSVEADASFGGAFAYCRIGLCVLLDAARHAGRAALSSRDGVATGFAFPVGIVTRDQLDPATRRFHTPFDAVRAELPSGGVAGFAFEGAEFEFEDQRNWTDATFKAYSAGPWPRRAHAGETIRQAVRLRIEGRPAPSAVSTPDLRIRLGAPVAVVPPIGLYRGPVSPHAYRPGGGFQELNARRPGADRLIGVDAVELGVNGAVHADDPLSVLETTALHGAIVTQTRDLYPGLPVRLAPVTFLDAAGDWRDAHGGYSAAPTDEAPTPGLLGGFAATWALASAARALPAGPALVQYFTAALPADTPAALAVERLAGLAGRDVLEVAAPEGLAVLAVADGSDVVLAVANTSLADVEYLLPDGAPAVLAAFASAWHRMPAERLVDQVAAS